KGKIGRITTAGVVTEFPLAGGSLPYQIVVGPDGALWFTEGDGNMIGRSTTAGAITELPVTTPSSFPTGLAVGPDGAIRVTASHGNKIGRLAPVAPTGPSPLVASILPTSRSVQAGNFASAFATVINTGATTLQSCRIAASTFVTGFFSFQTTDPQTNALSG